MKSSRTPAHLELLRNKVKETETSITQFLTPKEKISLHISGLFHQAETRSDKYWQDKLIEAGCKSHILQTFIEKSKLTNFKKLYRNFILMRKMWCEPLTKAWELCCLSGKFETESMTDEHHALRLLALSGSSLSIFDHCMWTICNSLTSKDLKNGNILHYAIMSGNVENIAWVLKNKVITDTWGNNALHIAAAFGIETAAVWSLEHLKYCSATNLKGMNALHCAALMGHSHIFKLLLTKVPATETDYQGNNVQHYAALSGDIATMQFAFQIKDLDPSAINDAGQNSLHLAARSYNPEAILFIRKFNPRLKATTKDTYEKDSFAHARYSTLYWMNDIPFPIQHFYLKKAEHNPDIKLLEDALNTPLQELNVKVNKKPRFQY